MRNYLINHHVYFKNGADSQMNTICFCVVATPMCRLRQRRWDETHMATKRLKRFPAHRLEAWQHELHAKPKADRDTWLTHTVSSLLVKVCRRVCLQSVAGIDFLHQCHESGLMQCNGAECWKTVVTFWWVIQAEGYQCCCFPFPLKSWGFYMCLVRKKYL